MKYDFDDILLQPTIISKINSRYKHVNPLTEDKKYPLFTAPMLDVINDKNLNVFDKNKIYSILPRRLVYSLGSKNYTSYNKNVFQSLSLKEFKVFLHNNDFDKSKTNYINIDIANGHQKQLFTAIKIARYVCKNKLILMVGSVANPKTYTELSNIGVDYVKIGIGVGSCCLTTQQTGVGFPIASLIKETYIESIKLNTPAKIVVDGGIRKYSDIIKALALGADFVLIGGLFNKALESAADTYLWKKFKVNQKFAKWLFKNNFKLYKRYRGMSTKEVQRIFSNTDVKTSEGTVKYNQVEWLLEDWIENFDHYLRSAMSYCGASNLDEFIGKVEHNIISQNAYRRFTK